VKLVEINWAPSVSQLKQFGAMFAMVLPLIGWFWSVGSIGLVSLFAAGLIVAVLSFVWPSVVRPLFVGLMLAAAPMGMLVGELAMLGIFLGVFLPISLVFKLMGRDALCLKIEKNVESYWQTKKQPEQVSSYYRRY